MISDCTHFLNIIFWLVGSHFKLPDDLCMLAVFFLVILYQDCRVHAIFVIIPLDL